MIDKLTNFVVIPTSQGFSKSDRYVHGKLFEKEELSQQLCTLQIFDSSFKHLYETKTRNAYRVYLPEETSEVHIMVHHSNLYPRQTKNVIFPIQKKTPTVYY